MKTIVQDQEEDDLAAEEENKIINEVKKKTFLSRVSPRAHSSSPSGIQDMVKP
jgi:hypothetical protein